jgi:hypothetical protein
MSTVWTGLGAGAAAAALVGSDYGGSSFAASAWFNERGSKGRSGQDRDRWRRELVAALGGSAEFFLFPAFLAAAGTAVAGIFVALQGRHD